MYSLTMDEGDNEMQPGNVVFHKRLDKGPGTVVQVERTEYGKVAKVFWQRDLITMEHPQISLCLAGIKESKDAP